MRRKGGDSQALLLELLLPLTSLEKEKLAGSCQCSNLSSRHLSAEIEL